MCDSKFYRSIQVLPCCITHLILSLASLALADAHTNITHSILVILAIEALGTVANGCRGP